MTKATKKMGRPSSYSEAIASDICARLMKGESLREICDDESMPGQATVYRWLADEAHEDFRERYAHAREVQADRLFDEMLSIADDSRNDYVTRLIGEVEVQVVDAEAIQRSKLRIDTRKWMAAKLRPKVYGDKTAVEHSGSVTITHEQALAQLDE